MAKYFAKVRKQKQNKEKIEKNDCGREKIDQGGDEYVERGLCRAYGIGCFLYFFFFCPQIHKVYLVDFLTSSGALLYLL